MAVHATSGPAKGGAKGGKPAKPGVASPKVETALPKLEKDRPCKDEMHKRGSCKQGPGKCKYSHDNGILTKFWNTECPHKEDCWFWKNKILCCFGKHSGKRQQLSVSNTMKQGNVMLCEQVTELQAMKTKTGKSLAED